MNGLPKISLAELEQRLDGRHGKARCPAHEDRRESLTYSQGDSGGLVVKCHAGCEFKEVLAAVGLHPSQLMPEDDSRGPRSTTTTKAIKPSSKPRGNGFATADEAVEVYARQFGRQSDLRWEYHDAHGQTVGHVLRWNTADGGKDIRPVALVDGRWHLAAMPEPRPLYGLPEVLGSSCAVWIVEGEKACDALRSIGLTAATSAGGAKAASKADWSTLAGREVCIWPDFDEPGELFAAEVVATLLALEPAATVRIVRPFSGDPDAAKGDDAFDWVERRDAVGPEDLRAQLEALVAKAEEVEPDADVNLKEAGAFVDNESPLIEPFRDFPVGALPEPVRGFVQTAAAALRCDPCFIALPILVSCAAAVGNTRRLQLRKGYTEPAILWGMLIAFSGEAKTPALELSLRAIKDKERRAYREWKERMRQFEGEIVSHKRDVKEFERGKLTTAPLEPEEPVCPQFTTSDTTTEALADLLSNQPRGLLVAVDELAGWFASHERYSGGDSSAAWLEMFGGNSTKINRKTGTKVLYVPNASVSIIGGIQPAALKQHLTAKHRASGMAARFLVAMPPRRQLQWTEKEVPDEVVATMGELINRLLSLEPEPPEDAFSDPKAKLLRFDAAAKSRFIEFHDSHASEQRELDAELAASWSKLRGYIGRLCIVIHAIKWANGEIAPERELIVDAETVDAAVALVEWFGHETRRVYATLRETDNQAAIRDVVDWLVQRGGEITPRELVQSRRQFKDVNEARTYLAGLEGLGYGSWREECSGGRPKRTFVLSPKYKRTPFVDNESPSSFQISLGERFVDEQDLDAIDEAFPD